MDALGAVKMLSFFPSLFCLWWGLYCTEVTREADFSGNRVLEIGLDKTTYTHAYTQLDISTQLTSAL